MGLDSSIDSSGAIPAFDGATVEQLACRAGPAVVSSPVWELVGRPIPTAPVQRTPVSSQPFTIGREADNVLCLANPTISRRHAELLLVENDLFVHDLGSRNGTFLNGLRVERFERLAEGDMLQFGAAIFSVCAPRHESASTTHEVDRRTVVDMDIADYALANLQFDKLLRERAVDPHFQPIVALGDLKKVGYEVLGRSRLPGLESPDLMFRIASERNLEAQLSDVLRHEGLHRGRNLVAKAAFYLNTHPCELGRPELLESLERLRHQFPEAEIVLEIHEAAVTSSQLLSSLRSRLRSLNMRLAYDDFGAGQSRLMELVDVPPDVLKFDQRLIHDLPTASTERQNMVRSLVQIVRELAVIPLAEGVETADEARVCRQLGFELAQGYYFGHPIAAPFPNVDRRKPPPGPGRPAGNR